MVSSSPEIFISYSRADETFARSLMHELDEQSITYWSDRNILAGSLWIDEIESAMKRASVFVLVISPSFEASQYAQFEAGIAVGRAQESGAQVIPILLPGASLPPALRSYQSLRADSMTVENVAAKLGEVVRATDRRIERPLTILRLFVSAPDDVTAEREIVSRVVEEVNSQIGLAEGAILQRYTWESLPAVEARPQDAVNSLLRQTDIFLLILATRVGAAIRADLGSGTEDEYRIVVDSWRRTGRPQILCYLKTAPVKLGSLDELEQMRRVLAFSDQLKRDNLVYEFESTTDFEHAVRLHLTKIIPSLRGGLTRG